MHFKRPGSGCQQRMREIENPGGWLTTVVSRICLNTLRSRQRRPSASIDDVANIEEFSLRVAVTPEDQAVLADSMGHALLIVLDRLNPAERISFVLHDMFSVPYEEIVWTLGKSEEACRQLASRARRRVRLAEDRTADPLRQREIVDAFLVAAKTGDFELLLSFLSPDVELVADASAIAMGAPTTLVGPHDVASRFSGGAKAARLALLDGLAGLVWAQGGTPKVAFDFTVVAGKVSRIEMIADHDVLDEIDIAFVRRGATNAES